MFCSNCGKQIDDSAKFCNSCGAAIEGTAQIQEEAVQQPEAPQAPVEQATPVSQPEASQPVYQEPVSQPEASQPAYQAPVQQTPAEPKGEVKKVKKVKTGKKLDKKKLIIGGVIALVIIIIIAAAGGFGDDEKGPDNKKPGINEKLDGTADFIDALNNGDAYAAYLLYDDAVYNDADKVEKYIEISRAKVDEIIKALVEYDYETAVTTSDNVVEDFLTAEYGTLVISDDFDYSLEDCLPYEDPKMEELDSAIDDALEYSDGVKHFVTREDSYDVANAIESMAVISETSPFYYNAQAKMVEYSKAYLDETMKTVDSYMASGDFASAVELISGLRSDFENMGLDTATIDKVLNAILTEYAETYVKKADEAFKNKDARAAIGNMDAALQLCPDNAEYKAKRDEYTLYLPFELYKNENKLTEEGTGLGFGPVNSITANDGTEMTNCLKLSISSKGEKMHAKTTYNLAGKYDYVSGKMFLPEDRKNDSAKGYIKVYGDGVLIYESPVITAGVLPQDVWFSVTGVQTLEIEFYGVRDYVEIAVSSHIAVSNLVAQKNFPEVAE